MTSAHHQRYDTVVVGARCAGAATAMLLARQGQRVLAIDHGRYGSDTVSTHALMRAGVVQLHRWGLLDAVKAAGTPTVRSTTFHYGKDVVEVKIKARDGVDGLYAPRRTVIDRLLVDAARESGADIVFEAALIGLVRAADGRVCGAHFRDAAGQEHQVTAELVIGADGVRSTVAQLVDAPTYRTGRHATGVLFSYFANTGCEGYTWYYGQGVAVGAIPTNAGHTCIFVGMPHTRFQEELRGGTGAGHQRLLNACDADFGAIIAKAERTEKYHGFAGVLGYFRQSYGPGWALVGDAGYFKDPLTAHGMTDALVDAELLARAAAVGSESAFAAYQQARDERATRLFEVTDALASFDWDMAKAQELHLALSEELKRETTGVASEVRG